MDPGEKGVVHRAGLAMQDLASILSSGSDEEESLQDPSPAPPSVFPSVVSTNLVELNIYLSREEFKELERRRQKNGLNSCLVSSEPSAGDAVHTAYLKRGEGQKALSTSRPRSPERRRSAYREYVDQIGGSPQP
eukprot:TRINITY_DN3213_c0_g1_i1.p1 TRINITY_DN3213_c0_g1~~TRINITY_DN3213_c0_g1_i1.p1  ORF type:complete len:148 (-),score=21.10 TRINITY_DN3213_c0_g1_i1:49-450(-)